MKKVVLTLLIFISIVQSSFSQGIPDVPWKPKQIKGNSKMIFKQLMQNFESYKNSFDYTQKGSGIKPFERWRSLWQPYFYRKDGFRPIKDIDDAFNKKQRLRLSTNDNSNWYSIGPSVVDRNGSTPGIGRVNFILIDPTNDQIMYVGAPAGGIWKSTNGGADWTPLTDQLPQIGVSAIALSPVDHNTIYIGTGDDDASDSYSRGVYKSTDGGQTWNPIGPNFNSDFEKITEIIVHPTQPNTIYVASSNGLYKTTNGGNNWNRVLNENIKEMRMHPTNPNYIYAVTETHFYRSSNGGANFSMGNINYGYSRSRMLLEVTPAAPNKVYVLAAKGDGSFGGLYISNDSGANFTKTQQSSNFFASNRQVWYDFALAVSDTDPNKIFVGNLNLSRSTDGGNTIANINDWASYTANYTHADIHFIRYYNGKLVVGSDGGIFVSTDDGDNFTAYNNNLEISMFYRISTAKTQNYQIYGGLQDNGGFARKDMQWRIYHGGDGMDNAIDNNNPSKGYGFIYYGQSMSITNDGGISVSNGVPGPQNEHGNWVTPLEMGADGSLYAGFSKLYKLENYQWVPISQSFFDNIDVVRCDPNNPNIIYVSEGSTLYKSTDMGASFNSIANAFSDISSIEINPFDNRVWYATDTQVFESQDNGNTWNNISTNLPGEHINMIKWHKFSPSNSLYLATDLGVYYRDDNSNGWQVFANHLPNTRIKDLEVNNEIGILTAATFGRGLWETTIPQYHPNFDLAVTDIYMPNSLPINCDLNNQQVKVKIKNKGNSTVNSFVLNYEINGNQASINHNTPLSAGQEIEINIPQQAWSVGKYVVKASVVFNNDQQIQNNSKETYFVFNDRKNLNFSSSFENVVNDKLLSYKAVGNSIWEIATPTGSVLNQAGSGTKAYCTNASGNYNNQSLEYLVTPCFDMTQVINPSIQFKLAFDLEQDYDAFYVQYSTDYGQTWSVLGNATDNNWYNSDIVQTACIGSQWTGTNATMQTYSHSLSSVANETHVMFRFVLASDQLVNQEGIVLDDLEISGVSAINNNHLEKNVMLFPNPANHFINIKWNNGLNVSQVSIYNTQGQELLDKNINNQNFIKLNISKLPKSLYLIKLQSDKGEIVKRLLVK